MFAVSPVTCSCSYRSPAIDERVARARTLDDAQEGVAQRLAAGARGAREIALDEGAVEVQIGAVEDPVGRHRVYQGRHRLGRRFLRPREPLRASYERRSGFVRSRCGRSASSPSVSRRWRSYSAYVPSNQSTCAVALEREDVRRDAVEEPAIMADDDGAAGEVDERVLEGAQRVDVEVVRRLVEQQQVAARAEQLGQVQAVALAAREVADLLLLVRAAEVERRDVGAALHLALADHDQVEAVGDLLPDGVRPVEVGPALVDVGELDRVAAARASPLSGSSWPAIMRKSVVLPAPFGPITPTMPPGGQRRSSRSSIRSRSP